MAAIGSVYINLVARTKAFSKGMKSASASLRRFSGVAVKFGAAGAGAAVAGLAAMTKAGLASVDATAKMADKLALSTEALSAWQFGAGQAGISSEALSGSIERMVRRVGLFANGSGAAAQALTRLGFAQDQLGKLGTAEQFKLIAERISQLPTHAERSAAAFEIFGRQGQQLLPMLQGGSEGLNAMSAEAERLGISFSRIDAAQVEAANDSVSRLWAVFKGLTQQLAIKLSPLIDALATKMTDWAAGANAGTGLVAKGFGYVAQGIGVAADGIHFLYVGFKGIQAGIVTGLSMIVSGFVRWANALEAVINMIPGVKVEFTGMLNDIADSVEQSAKAQRKEFADAWNKPLPSEKINRFVKDLEAKAAAKGAAVAKSAAARTAVAAKPAAGTGALGGLFAGLGGRVTGGLAAVKSFGASLFQGGAGGGAAAATGGPARPQFAGLAEAGSAEAFRALRQTNTPQKNIERINQQQLTEAKRQTAVFRDIGGMIASAIGKIVAVPS